MHPNFTKTLLLLSLLSTIGCSATYYKPNVMNMPNFKEKNEVFLSANLATSDFFYAFEGDVQAAYAVTKHLGIQGNYMRGSDIVYEYRYQGSDEIKRFFSCSEAAVGYHTIYSDYLTFSVFGGYGRGRAENEVKNNGKSSADFSKLFIQPSAGFRMENVEFVISAKLASLNYKNSTQSLTEQSRRDNFFALQNTIPVVETGWMMRVGSDKLKFQLQATTATALGPNPLFQYSPLTLSTGFTVQLNTKPESKLKQKSKSKSK
jgi:hypothetical protein